MANMAIVLVFMLGVFNFALHKAVLDKRRQLLEQLPPGLRRFGGRASLLAEFVLLVGALLLVGYGHSAWGWAYLGYSALNAAAGWLLLRRKI